LDLHALHVPNRRTKNTTSKSPADQQARVALNGLFFYNLK
jgi:hypothetical protein